MPGRCGNRGAINITPGTHLSMQETKETPVRSLVREDPLEQGMQPTPVFLPGEFHGQRGLAGCSAWGRKESDRTEAT